MARDRFTIKQRNRILHLSENLNRETEFVVHNILKHVSMAKLTIKVKEISEMGTEVKNQSKRLKFGLIICVVLLCSTASPTFLAFLLVRGLVENSTPTGPS